MSQNTIDSTNDIEKDPLRNAMKISYKNSTYISMITFFKNRLIDNETTYILDSLFNNKAPLFMLLDQSYFLNDKSYKNFISELINLKSELYNDSEPDATCIMIVENEQIIYNFVICYKEDLVKYIKLLIKYFHEPIGIPTEMVEKYMTNEK